MPARRPRPRSDDAAAASSRLVAVTPGPVPGGWVPGPPADVLAAAAGEEVPLPDQSEAVTWRGLRLDPGWSGALVLVVVAVAAALLAGWLVLRSRPAVVAVPPGTAVEQAGDVASAGPPGAALGAGTPGAGGVPSPVAGAGTPAVGEPAEVVVAVAGLVARPGVVRLPAGSRVVDAVEATGGVAPGADAGLLNLARVLVDGEQVLVGVEPPPGAEAAAAAPAAGAAPGGGGGRVDLNRADVADLDALPGVGPVLAERILAHRAALGRFASVGDLRDVTGIGEARFAELEPLVSVG